MRLRNRFHDGIFCIVVVCIMPLVVIPAWSQPSPAHALLARDGPEAASPAPETAARAVLTHDPVAATARVAPDGEGDKSGESRDAASLAGSVRELQQQVRDLQTTVKEIKDEARRYRDETQQLKHELARTREQIDSIETSSIHVGNSGSAGQSSEPPARIVGASQSDRDPTGQDQAGTVTKIEENQELLNQKLSEQD